MRKHYEDYKCIKRAKKLKKTTPQQAKGKHFQHSHAAWRQDFMPHWDRAHMVFPRDRAQCCVPVCWKHLPFPIEPYVSLSALNAYVQRYARREHFGHTCPAQGFPECLCVSIGSQLCWRLWEQWFPSSECACSKVHPLWKQREKHVPLSVPKLVGWQENGLGFAELWFSFWLLSAITAGSLRPSWSTRKENHGTMKIVLYG